MSSQRQYVDVHAVIAGAMTGTAVVTSSQINTFNSSMIGITATWTGAAVGTFAFQVSNDNSNWATITLDNTLTNPNNNAGTTAGKLNVNPFSYVRLIYTNTSSTGTLDIWITAKGE
jgi:hypothetical protein